MPPVTSLIPVWSDHELQVENTYSHTFWICTCHKMPRTQRGNRWIPNKSPGGPRGMSDSPVSIHDDLQSFGLRQRYINLWQLQAQSRVSRNLQFQMPCPFGRRTPNSIQLQSTGKHSDCSLAEAFWYAASQPEILKNQPSWVRWIVSTCFNSLPSRLKPLLGGEPKK